MLAAAVYNELVVSRPVSRVSDGLSLRKLDAPVRGGARLATFVVAAAVASCGRPGSRAAPEPNASTTNTPAFDPSELIPEVIADVGRARGLRLRQKVPVAFLDERAFAEALAQSDGEYKRSDQVLGFYDYARKRICVRRALPPWAERRSVRVVLAHELTHALQDQHGFLGGDPDMEVDERLASRALHEGDAMLIMEAVSGQAHGASVGAVAENLLTQAPLTPQLLIARGFASPSLLESDREAQLRATFPYQDGARFVATLVRSGGYALVDRAMRSPPRSSADILDPERYIAGLGRLRIGSIAPPSDAGSQRTLGALGLLGVLDGCLPAMHARAAVRGWIGDLEWRASKPSTDWVLATAWEDETSAAAFGSAAAKCERTRDIHVSRRGSSVALWSGATSTDTAERALTATQRARPAPAPPLGDVHLEPPPPEMFEMPLEAGGRLLDPTRWVSEYLGVTIAVPEGYAAKPRVAPNIAIEISRSKPLPRLGRIVVLGADAPLAIKDVTEKLRDPIRVRFPNPTERQLPHLDAKFGRLPTTEWRSRSSGVEIAFKGAFAFLCDARVALVVLSASATRDAGAAAELDAWTGSLARLPGDPRVCTDLPARRSSARR